MPCDDRQAQVATVDYEQLFHRQCEVAEIEAERSHDLTRRLAQERVEHRRKLEELRKVGHELLEVERQRKIANDALEMAIKIIAAGHEKDAPTHKSGEAPRSVNCKTCIQLRTLNRQLVRSARPESRMALVS